MPSRSSPGIRRAAAALTVVVHAGLMGLLVWGAERGRRGVPVAPPPEDEPVRVSLVALPEASVQLPEAPPPRPPDASPPPDEPTPRSIERTEPAPASPRSEPSPPTSSPTPTPQADTPEGNPIDLQSLRDSTVTEGRSGVFVPSAALTDATKRRVSEGAPRPRPAPEGPRTSFESGRVDHKPKSLGDAGFEPRKDGTYRYRAPNRAFKATLHPDGRLEFATHIPTGLTDALIAASGQERFWRAKQRLMASTYELRLSMARRWAKQQIQTQLTALGTQLRAVWRRSDRPAKQRRATIFELWDECEEGLEVPTSGAEDKLAAEVDAVRADAGHRARRTIVSFVRKHLPAGSDHAYPRRELDALNARRHSKQRFEPYDRRPAKEGSSQPQGRALRLAPR